MAPSVNHPALDCGSGHDLPVHEFKPCIGLLADSIEPAWDSLFSAHPHSHDVQSLLLSLKIEKLQKKKTKTKQKGDVIGYK